MCCLMRRALAIGEKSYGPEHPSVANSLNNLAGLLRDTKRLAEAEPLYRRALAIGISGRELRARRGGLCGRKARTRCGAGICETTLRVSNVSPSLGCAVGNTGLTRLTTEPRCAPPLPQEGAGRSGILVERGRRRRFSVLLGSA